MEQSTIPIKVIKRPTKLGNSVNNFNIWWEFQL